MSALDDTVQEKQNWHWRNTMRPVRFFNWDARAAIPFCLLLFYLRWSTLILCIVTLFVFNILEKKGLTFPSAMRSLRVWFLGPKRPAWISLRHRRMIDYG